MFRGDARTVHFWSLIYGPEISTKRVDRIQSYCPVGPRRIWWNSPRTWCIHRTLDEFTNWKFFRKARVGCYSAFLEFFINVAEKQTRTYQCLHTLLSDYIICFWYSSRLFLRCINVMLYKICCPVCYYVALLWRCIGILSRLLLCCIIATLH